MLMDLNIFNQISLSLLIIIPIILIARTVVSGSRYSPILIIVIFGLSMGLVMTKTNIVSQGLPELPVIVLISKITIVVLIASFFVGGQELYKIVFKKKLEIESLVLEAQEEVILGTKRTQIYYIIRSVFILLGTISLFKVIINDVDDKELKNTYPLIAYLGLIGSIILIDSKATIKNKALYLKKGLIEYILIIVVLIISYIISVQIKPIIQLPQIFFAMIISSSFGFLNPKWQFGPTIKSLLFAGIPSVLTANFLIGGSRILDAFYLKELHAVVSFGFFGQLFWMFLGLSVLIFIAKVNHIRNLAPGMAGSLSHAGLTGACTAGDFGKDAAARAPVMINIPFLGHIFVFSILAYSVKIASLKISFVFIIFFIGLILNYVALKILKNSKNKEVEEIKGLMIFSFSWQITAIFGSFIILYFANVNLNNSAMASSAALSHFGLFAAIQGGLFGNEAANIIPFVFAMPFLVHPFVFGIFGKAMTNSGVMPKSPVFILTVIGFLGILFSLFVL